MSKINPQEHDEKIATLYHELAKLEQRRESRLSALYRMVGAKIQYHGSKMYYALDGQFVKESDARNIVASYSHEQRNTRNLSAGMTPAEAVEQLDVALKAAGAKMNEIEQAEAAYTGWSRFFVVTSSAGHVHSSMFCHTCRPTTTFGWMPSLSGKSESEAVDELGPALCSECFKSAPTDYVGGKLTKAAANKVAA